MITNEHRKAHGQRVREPAPRPVDDSPLPDLPKIRHDRTLAREEMVRLNMTTEIEVPKAYPPPRPVGVLAKAGEWERYRDHTREHRETRELLVRGGLDRITWCADCGPNWLNAEWERRNRETVSEPLPDAIHIEARIIERVREVATRSRQIPHGAQSRIAADLGVDRRYVNRIAARAGYAGPRS